MYYIGVPAVGSGGETAGATGRHHSLRGWFSLFLRADAYVLPTAAGAEVTLMMMMMMISDDRFVAVYVQQTADRGHDRARTRSPPGRRISERWKATGRRMIRQQQQRYIIL